MWLALFLGSLHYPITSKVHFVKELANSILTYVPNMIHICPNTLHAFLLSFMGGAFRRYYSLDPNMTKVWNELMELFVDQFIFNTMIDVTLRVLETTKQGEGETFSEYMIRWKGKASKMVNRPNKKDQINMIIKNLLPAYNNRLLLRMPSIMGN